MLMALGLAGLLAGCASTQTSTDARPATMVAANTALIFPPPGGPGILGVVETRFPNALRQQIALSTDARTPGENMIAVTMFHASSGGDEGIGPQDSALDQDKQMAEAQAAWPDVAFTTSPFFVQNAYGPFGYAAGRSQTGDTCVYAWQRIEARRGPSGARKSGAVSIRLQLCDSRKSEKALLSTMYTLRLTEQVHEPLAAPARIGRIGNPIVPESPRGFANVLEDEPVVTRTVRRTTTVTQPVPQPVAAPVVQPIVPTGPIVPSPMGTRAITGTQAPAANPSPSVIVPRPPTGSGS